MKPIPSSIKRSLALSKFKLSIILALLGFGLIGKYLNEFDFYVRFLLNDNSPVAEATILDVWLEYYDEENAYYKYGYVYGFYAPSGEYIQWTAYSDFSNYVYSEGQKIPVRYYADEPRINRAAGMIADNSNAGHLFSGCFLLFIALVFAYYSPYRYLVDLLHHRRYSLAHVVWSEKLSTTDSFYRTLYKIVYQYPLESGKEIRSYVKSHNPDPLKDDEKELIIYHAKEPTGIVVVDALPLNLKRFLYEEYEKESTPVKSNLN